MLEHGDFSLYETQAILRYLDRILPSPALTPPGAKEAARMDQLMNITDWYFFQRVANPIAFQRVVGPALMGITPDEAVIAGAMPRAHLVFDEVARLLGDKTYLAGGELSLADMMLAPQIDFFANIPEWPALTGHHPNLIDWLTRMKARPSMTANDLGPGFRHGQSRLAV